MFNLIDLPGPIKYLGSCVLANIIVLLLFCSLDAQNHLEVLGNAYVQGKLNLDPNTSPEGEFIQNTNSYTLSFFTSFNERMRIENDGTIKLFVVPSRFSSESLVLANGELRSRKFIIGDSIQGGIVFWVDPSGEHGLVCAYGDSSADGIDFTIRWSDVSSATLARGDGIGAGELNTLLAAFQDDFSQASAIKLAFDHGDWYLPSKYELELMHDNLYTAGLGDFADAHYWSSTEFSDPSAWMHLFTSNSQFVSAKSNEARARLIKKF